MLSKKKKNIKYDTLPLVLQVFGHNCNFMSSQCSSSVRQLLEDSGITTKSTELMLAMSVASKLKNMLKHNVYLCDTFTVVQAQSCIYALLMFRHKRSRNLTARLEIDFPY